LTSLRELLLWLNDWPGGVKLNFELASLFCDAFLWGTGLWEECEIASHSRIAFSSSRNFLIDIFIPVLPYLPSLVYALGLSGLLGTTMFLSLAADLLSLLTLHIYIFYLMATFVFSWHLSMLGALFNIFRGECRTIEPLSCLSLPEETDEELVRRREKIQFTAKSSGASGIRRRSIITRNDSIHFGCFPIPNCPRLLPGLRFCKPQIPRAHWRMS
jgi:hypothetical protein